MHFVCSSSCSCSVQFSSETLIYKKAWLNVQFSDAHTHSCCLTIYDLTGHFLSYLAKLYSLWSDFCHPFFGYIICSMPSLYVLDTGCDSSPFPCLLSPARPFINDCLTTVLATDACINSVCGCYLPSSGNCTGRNLLIMFFLWEWAWCYLCKPFIQCMLLLFRCL